MPSRLTRWLLRFATLVVAMVLGVAVLVFGFGLRLVQYGGGTPRPTFTSRASHDAALERHRSAQEATAPRPVAPATSTPAAPTPAASPSAPAPSATSPPAEKPRAAVDAYWTDFRGPSRDGKYDQRAILTAWPQDGLRPVWKQPIGGGYASFAIADGRLFTIEHRFDKELVVSYDAETGRELWTRGAVAGNRGGIDDGPRATPTWQDGRLYALGVEGELYALDARTGAPVWQRNILTDNGASNLTYGMAGSPLVVDDKVIVQPGGSNGRSIVAYHKDTGAPVWTALADRQAYTAPMLVTLGGVRQIVTVTAQRAVGLTVGDGTLLWEFPWTTDFDVNAAQPIVIGDNRLFLSAGYGHGAAVIELTRHTEGFTVNTVWQNNRMKNKFTSSVLHEGFIYGLDEAILACVNSSTGELQWKGGRYGYGQVVLASGHLIVLSEDGDLALVKATPASHQEVVRFSAIDGKTWNHPALADGRLFVRNGNEMAAFDLRRR